MTSSETKKTIANLKNDLSSKNHEEVYEAAGTCVCLLANQSFLSQIDTSSQKSLFDTLMKTLKSTQESKVMHRVLQSVASSRISKDIYVHSLSENLDTLCGILQTADLPLALTVEALKVVSILFVANPPAAAELGKSWFPCTFAKLFHTDSKVRKAAVFAFIRIGDALNKMSDSTAMSKFQSMVVGDLKNKHLKDMMHILDKGKYDILQVWRTVITLLGKELHTSKSLINSLLNLLEKAFKDIHPEVRVEAYLSWCTIIDSFALSKEAISSNKSLQMLMLPFRIQKVKTAEICRAKLHTWWHFICVLSAKHCLVPNFDLVLVPFLQFCFIRGLTPEGSKGAISNRNLIMSGALSSPGQAHSSLQHTSAEMLAQLLAPSSDIPRCTLTKEDIREHVVSSVFLRHYALLMKSFSEAVRSLNFNDAEQNALGIHLFCSLLMHVKTIATWDVQKKEAVDMVREFFVTLAQFENCEPGNSESHFLYEFYNILTIGTRALPKKIFNSHQYYISSSSSGGARDVLCGTLSNHLMAQLCSPTLLHYALTDDRQV